METTETVVQDVLPEFPKLTGPLGLLVDSITPDIPYVHKAMAALTYMGVALSGRTRLAGGDYDTLQTRFYSCLIGPPGSGKSAAAKEVKRALNGLGGVHVEGSINSERQFIESLSEHPRLIYAPDEAVRAMEKTKQAGLRAKILSLLEDNDAEYRLRGGDVMRVPEAHFAMILTATPQVFSNMWSGLGGASSGLQSRFVLSYSEYHMPLVKTGNDTFTLSLAVEQLTTALNDVPLEISLPEKKGDFTHGLIEGLNADDLSRDELTRVLDMGRRFALLIAACSGKNQIEAGDETIQLGRAFLRYQLSALDSLMPSDSWTWVQRFENQIITYFQRHAGEHSQRDVQNSVRPSRAPGGIGVFATAFNNLTKNTDAKQRNRPAVLIWTGNNRSNYPLWKLNPDLIL